MTNVIPFRSRIVSFREAPAAACAQDAVAMAGAGRHEATRSGVPAVRDDLRKTVILLDLALQHARELSDLVIDERAHRMFDRHLASIEYSLQIARERVWAS
ncbi:hypothetical protein [Bradyrhizobium sp. ORS 375]|uniref:hypothetical protein n=1 Tax=Bradyrhizobium sp. (strain ORS 375) TaxID=566679 RepID=UPI0009FE8D72|nr:hypothetical protein [Bradyrhizobium sp. ORS 375]